MHRALLVGLVLAAAPRAFAADESASGAAPPPASAPVAAPAVPAAAPPVAAPRGALVDRVAAVVNDEVVLLSEVYALGASYIDEAEGRGGAEARLAAEREVVERLVERVLIDQEMRALQLDLSEQDVDRSIDDIAERNGLDREQMRQEIERNGMEWEQYRKELRQSLRQMKFAQAVLRPRINVTEDELRDAYRRAVGGNAERARVQALFLAFPANADEAARAAVLARAASLREEAMRTGDFVAVAKAHDEGPFGAQDGEMGVFGPGELRDELDGAVTSTATGAVSAPVVTANGVFLLRVAARESAAAEFEEARAQLVEMVVSSRMESEQARWFQQARRKAAVRVLIGA